MARTVSSAFRKAFWEQETDKVPLLLLEVSYIPSGGETATQRFALNTEKVRQKPVTTAVNNGGGYSSGATQIVVDSVSGFAPLDPVVITLASGTDENIIAAGGVNTGTNTLTLAQGISGNVADDAAVSKYQDFSPFPFELELPSDDSQQLPFVKLKIDNIDGTLSQAIRDLSVAPTAKLMIVLADTPDVIEYETPEMTWVTTETDAMFIQGTLSGPQVLNQSYPMEDFSPSSHPALFRY